MTKKVERKIHEADGVGAHGTDDLEVLLIKVGIAKTKEISGLLADGSGRITH